MGGTAFSILNRVTFNNQQSIRGAYAKKCRTDIQQYTLPPLQELVIPLSGLGRAVTKTAMKAARKIASVDNMVKMSGWVC